MFAPKLAKRQTTATANSTNSPAPSRSTLVGRRPARSQIEQALSLPRAVDDNEQRAVSENMTPFAAPRRAAWDFGKISLFQPERPTRPQAITQPKLAVGSVDDPLEREADGVAEQVMSMPDPWFSVTAASPQIRRKCAACEEEEAKNLQTKPLTTRKTAAAVPGVVHEVLRSPGQPLDSGTRAFMEPRFGRDFSAIRIHADERAAISAETVNAQAYTLGTDIVFGRQRYRPDNPAGQKLLAHELVHTIQQDRGALRPRLQRKVLVSKPSDLIDNPGGKGTVQSNAATIDGYLKTLCPSGNPSVDAGTGNVAIDSSFCTTPVLPPGAAGPPDVSAAQKSTTATGCGCICDLVASSNLWTIDVDDKSWPHTDFDDADKADGRKPGGTGGTVTAPSPNSPKLWGAATASGKELNIDPWLVLGHEFCGHAWLGNSGSHGPDEASPRGEGGHQETVARENMLRAEHGIDLRGTFKDPQCGESFWRDKKKTGTVNWSAFRDVCIKFRERYNKTNKTNFKITDKMP